MLLLLVSNKSTLISDSLTFHAADPTAYMTTLLCLWSASCHPFCRTGAHASALRGCLWCKAVKTSVAVTARTFRRSLRTLFIIGINKVTGKSIPEQMNENLKNILVNIVVTKLYTSRATPLADEDLWAIDFKLLTWSNQYFITTNSLEGWFCDIEANTYVLNMETPRKPLENSAAKYQRFAARAGVSHV